MKPFKHSLLELAAKLLSGKITGKLFGLLLMLIPLVFLAYSLYEAPAAWWEWVLAVPVLYIGLFMGGFLHELGHVATLLLLGGRCRVKVLRNHHSKWLFFNMRTDITHDHPLLSTKYKLIMRAVSGLLSNIFFMLLFLAAGVALKSHLLLFLSAIQGFSGHGATSLSKLEGDTDVYTMSRALKCDDRITAELVAPSGSRQENSESGENHDLSTVKLHIELKYPDNGYWFLLRGAAITDYSGDFYSFDLGSESLFVQARKEATQFHIDLKLASAEQLVIISKTGARVKVA